MGGEVLKVFLKDREKEVYEMDKNCILHKKIY